MFVFADWRWIKGYITPRALVSWLPENEFGSEVALLEYFRRPSFSYASLMNDMFTVMETSEAVNWSRSEWYCLDCVGELIKNGIHSWASQFLG